MELDTTFSVTFPYRLRFTSDVFHPENSTLLKVIPASWQGTATLLIFVDDGVSQLRPELKHRIDEYLSAHRQHLTLAGPIQRVRGGELAKNEWATLETVLRQIHDARLCRQSYVVAIGGGAVLDVVGFAAAMAHRGIRLVRIPTTTLSQADSGVAVKNGVNAFGKKNFLGAFAPPWGVINDERFLTTLSDRDWRCGLSEAVKVSLVKDALLFDRIAAATSALRRRDQDAILPIVRRSCELHLQHILSGGDPFELTRARPLDFGHWSAHKLETMSGYRLRHGEAVAIGMALDILYAVRLGYLQQPTAEAILACLAGLGFLSFDGDLLDPGPLLEGLEDFREHLGGPLTIPMLRGIGEAFEVHEIQRSAMLEAMEALRERFGSPSCRAA